MSELKNIDNLKFTSIFVKSDYSYDKSSLFKTRIDEFNDRCFYIRDLIKLPTEEIKNGFRAEDAEKILYWKNKNILPKKDEYIQTGNTSYKLYIDNNFITKMDSFFWDSLFVSNFEVKYRNKIVYNYKNLTQDIYKDIYNFVYSFLNKYSYLKSDNNFKYMLNKQIDIRNNMINENHDINGDVYDSIAEIVHERLQSKFISGQMDVKEYNNYFEKLMNTELSQQNNNGLSNDIIPNLDFLVNKSTEEKVVNVTNFLFDIDIRTDQSTEIVVNEKVKYVLPYPCTVKQLNSSHYELSYDFIKYDLYIDGYLVYLNGELIATYLDLGTSELECVKNMANGVISGSYFNSPLGISKCQSMLEDYQYIFKRLASETVKDKCYREKTKK